MTSRSPTTLEQDAGSGSKNNVRATVTGVDSADQLFRDNAPVVFLKGQKCVYLSRFKPSSDSSVMIEIRGGGETWRSNARVRGVSPSGADPNTFRVTVELDRAHTLVIEEPADSAPVPRASGAATESKPPSTPVAPLADTAVSNEPASDMSEDATPPDFNPPPFAAPLPAGLKGGPAGGSIRPAPAPTPAARAVVADVVRSIMAAEAEKWKSGLREEIVEMVEAALRQPLDTIEAKVERHLQKRPALTEESVRKIAAQEAEDARKEWASTSRSLVAEAVRSGLAADAERQRRETRALVSGEIEAALRGPLATRMEAKVDKAVDARFEEHSRKRSTVTEETVRRLAAEVAGSVQLEWASTRLQKMVSEIVRSALAAESQQRQVEAGALVSNEVDKAIRGPVADRIDAAIEKTLATKIQGYFQTTSARETLQELVAEAVHQPLEAEYERRLREVQAVVSSQIEAAVRGPIASQMDGMLRKALDAQRAEYLRTPPPISEETIRKITANIAQHPQLRSSIDALAANLTERWTEIARGATATAQQDINTRIAETERLANQVVLDIQQKLNSFNAEMNRILGPQESASSDGSRSADQPEREKRFRELLQSTGAHFEREMKAALQKIFGGS